MPAGDFKSVAIGARHDGRAPAFGKARNIRHLVGDAIAQDQAARPKGFAIASEDGEIVDGAGDAVGPGTDQPDRGITRELLPHLGQDLQLRGIFAFNFHGPASMQNPMLSIRNMKVVKKLPDPLTAAERDAILGDMAKHYDKRITAYFRFAFYTGMRPEELIALQWGDIDFGMNTARVQRVRTFRGSEREGSKTHSVRDVDLVAGALDALKVMKAYTFLKQDSAATIFEHPVTGKPFHDERAQRDTFWVPTLRRLGIRSRRCYATRHTYATVLLHGVPPAYIAHQLGHVDSKQVHEKYAR